MLIEVAKGVASLGRAVEILVRQMPEGEARSEVTEAAEGAEKNLREFIRLVDVEWLKNDE